MYSMNTNDVEIIDEGIVISVLNKRTGESARAQYYTGCVNHKRRFAISYSGKPKGFAVLASGRLHALSECLRLVGLPSYRTLKTHEARSLDSQIHSATVRAEVALPTQMEPFPVKKKRESIQSVRRIPYER